MGIFDLAGSAQGASWLFGGGGGFGASPGAYVDTTGTTLPTGAGWLSGGAAPSPSNPSAAGGDITKALEILGKSSLAKGTGEEGGGGGGGAPGAAGGSGTGGGRAPSLDALVQALRQRYMGLYPGGATKQGNAGLLGV
jgi:hypothetical protein